MNIHREVTTRDLAIGVNAYAPDPDENDWSFQLTFYSGHATSLGFSGLTRDSLTQVRDRINAVLIAAEEPGA